MLVVLAMAGMLVSDPSGISCATWNELRTSPPSGGIVAAWVMGHVAGFNRFEMKNKLPGLDYSSVMRELDADCRDGKGTIGSHLYNEESAFEANPVNPPPPPSQPVN